MYFVPYPKQGLRTEGTVLHWVGFLEYFCPKQGQDFKPLAAPLYPNMVKYPTQVLGKSSYSHNAYDVAYAYDEVD